MRRKSVARGRDNLKARYTHFVFDSYEAERKSRYSYVFHGHALLLPILLVLGWRILARDHLFHQCRNCAVRTKIQNPICDGRTKVCR
jgi:hypothetical protein